MRCIQMLPSRQNACADAEDAAYRNCKTGCGRCSHGGQRCGVWPLVTVDCMQWNGMFASLCHNAVLWYLQTQVFRNCTSEMNFLTPPHAAVLPFRNQRLAYSTSR